MRPMKNSRGFYSHKTHGSCVRYQITVGIRTGEIVHLEGPYPAGHWPDINIYRRNLKELLEEDEMVVADLGYRGDETVITPDDSTNPHVLQLMSTARGRHEGINGLFKQFRILRDMYRHDRSKHEKIVKCVAILVQLKIQRGEGTYDIVDDDIPKPVQPPHPFARDPNEVRNVSFGLSNRSVTVQLEPRNPYPELNLFLEEDVDDNVPNMVTQEDEE